MTNILLLEDIDGPAAARIIAEHFDSMSATDQGHIRGAVVRVQRKVILKDFRGRPRASGTFSEARTSSTPCPQPDGTDTPPQES